jgi:DNA polymerase (family 10)
MLDVVSAGIRSHFNLNRKEQTSRIISTMDNPNVDIISHPTSRTILQQQQQYVYDIDIGEIIHIAKDTNTILEINASPNRLDLSEEHIRIAVENDDNCKLLINSDAHSISDMHLLKFGLAQARRDGLNLII